MTDKDKLFRDLLRSILLNTKPYNQNWEFPSVAKTDAIHQKLRNMLGITDAEWQNSINNDTQKEMNPAENWKEILAKGVSS